MKFTFIDLYQDIFPSETLPPPSLGSFRSNFILFLSGEGWRVLAIHQYWLQSSTDALSIMFSKMTVRPP